MHLPRSFGKIKVTLETKVNPAFIKQKQMEDFDFKSACFFFLIFLVSTLNSGNWKSRSKTMFNENFPGIKFNALCPE